MMKKLYFAALVLFASLFLIAEAFAHVPYFEHWDFNENWPFQVRNSIDQSIAVYSWLEFDGWSPSTDIDLYTFELTEPSRVFIESLVPVCVGYEDFLPWFALVGPGLPEPEMELPFEIPEGYGAVVVENVEPGEPRETFYEFFGGKSYYQGPGFDETVYEPGHYAIYFWDPYEMGGDYVSVIGYAELWGFWDIIRALIYTPLIRMDRELHIECVDPDAPEEFYPVDSQLLELSD